jgi:4-diphosphocytidyl-2-C-methyl-D-erythritol kinase
VSVALRLDAPAKLNLSLRVVGRRDDGLHELESELVLLELADRLLLLPGCSGLRVDGTDARSLPLGPDNLAWRGLVAGLGGEPDLACLSLEKHVPVAAGLGGGSSDAAAAWRLGRAWNQAVPASEVEVAALARIGADVPFFAAAVPAARVAGVGERVVPIAASLRHVVLLHPPFGLSTGEVFGELRREEWGTAGNDLLAPAIRLRPELGDLLAAMTRAGGEPQLSGSGSTLFTLTDDPERAAAVAASLRAGGARVTLTATRTDATAIERFTDPEED